MLSDPDARAIAERLFDQSVPVFEYDILVAIEAIKALPATAIEILDQREIKFYPVNTGVTIDQASPIYRQHVEKYYPDPASRAELIAKVSAAFVPAERRIYIVDPDPGTIVHEVGHVVDDALSPHGWSSTTDNLLAVIHANESLNEYSRGSVVEAWAEWYRAWRDVPNPEGMHPSVDDRDRDALVRHAPTAHAYLEAIDRAIELALDEHPRAFAEGRDLQETVVLRAQLAVKLGIEVEELSLGDITVALRMLRDEQGPAPNIGDTHAPSIGERFAESIAVPADRDAAAAADRLAVVNDAQSHLRASTILRSAVHEVPVPQGPLVRGEIVAISDRYVAVSLSARSYAIVDRSDCARDIGIYDRVEIRHSNGSRNITRVADREHERAPAGIKR